MKPCTMCPDGQAQSGDVCNQCRSWWHYHLVKKKHGPTYFVGYLAKAEKAIARVNHMRAHGARRRRTG